MNNILELSTESGLRKLYFDISAYSESKGMNPMPAYLTIRISSKLGYNTYGQARYFIDRRFNRIEVKEILMNAMFVRTHSYEEIRDVFIHECAHIYVLHYYKERGHGPLWARVAKALGSVGTRFYNNFADRSVAYEKRDEVAPVLVDFVKSMTSKDVHAMRCSMAGMCRKYGMAKTRENFMQFVAPRYKAIFSSTDIEEACNLIFS